MDETNMYYIFIRVAFPCIRDMKYSVTFGIEMVHVEG